MKYVLYVVSLVVTLSLGWGSYAEQERITSVITYIKLDTTMKLDSASRYAGVKGYKPNIEQRYINKDTIIDIKTSEVLIPWGEGFDKGRLSDSNLRVYYKKEGAESCALFNYVDSSMSGSSTTFLGTCDQAEYDELDPSNKMWMMIWLVLALTIAQLLFSDIKRNRKNKAEVEEA